MILRANFLEHFVSGLSLDFSVAIDFSSSSSDIHQKKESPYWQALKKLGRSLEIMDAEQNYPVFTFGAQKRLKDTDETCEDSSIPLKLFPVVANDLSTEIYPGCVYLNQAEAAGFSRTFDAFEEAAMCLKMQEPTNITDFITQICEDTKERTNSDAQGDFYSILIILTGIIHFLYVNRWKDQ